MQRIDENAYIDDSLVTCAEYQLFIDEMREQGKHYQPDHWKALRFPQGQARKPILGIRLGDAEAFCDWLTQRDNGEYLYRLPTFAQTVEYPLKLPVQSSLCYWTIDLDSENEIAWVGPKPVNPRDLSRVALADALNIDIVRAQTRALDRAAARDAVLPYVRDLDLDRSLSVVRERIHPRDLVLTLDLFLDALARDLVLNNLSRAFDRGRKLDRGLDLDRSLSRYLLPARNGSLSSALDIYIDIFTLQERIAGRSPAFEGIRLVKERIR